MHYRGCFCDNWKPSFLPRLTFNWRTFSRRVTVRWRNQWAKMQVSTNQNSRNGQCQIVRGTVCTPFLDTQELHSWSNLKHSAFMKQISVYFYIFLSKNICFRDVAKFYLVLVVVVVVERWWDGGRLNNFLKAARCSGLAKCFTIFHFNWNFWKFNYSV